MPTLYYGLPKHPVFNEHHWADWVELLCVADPDTVMDESRVRQEARQQNEDLGEGSSIDEGEEEADESLEKAEKVDRWNKRVENWFAHLRFRARQLGSAYPFVIKEGENSVRLKAPLTDAHKLYLALLMASNLNYFPKDQSNLTASFEVFCLVIFKQWMPAPAEVMWFGANKLNKTEFTGRLWKKVGMLAERLNETVTAKEGDFPKNDCGDHGLDLLARIPSGDTLPGTVLMFGQCACTVEWVDKQDSSSGNSWKHLVSLMSNPLNVVFIPFCLRNSDGTWHQPSDQRGHVLMDRVRLIHFLNDRLAEIIALPAFSAVEKLLKTTIDLN
jgi:hypothetical protein